MVPGYQVCLLPDYYSIVEDINTFLNLDIILLPMIIVFIQRNLRNWQNLIKTNNELS